MFLFVFYLSSYVSGNIGGTLQFSVSPSYHVPPNTEERFKWVSFSIGGVAGIGATNGQFATWSLRSSLPRALWEPNIGVEGPWGKSKLIGNVKPTSERGLFDKAIAWVTFIGTGVPGISVGNAVLALVACKL